MVQSFLKRCNGSGITMLILLSATLTLTGCAGFSPATLPSKALWQLRDQYVAVAPKEQTPNALPNDHPADLTADQLQWALASLKFHPKENDTPVPLFTEYELSVLSTNLSTALSHATANEEAIFATIGNHSSLLGLAKRPMVTTGRLFVAEGKLNLILGKIHEDVSDREDRRLNPFVPGSRSGATDANFGRIRSGIKGVELKNSRQDWILIPIAGLTAAPPLTKETPGNSDRSPESSGTAPAVKRGEEPAGSVSQPRAKSPEDRLRTLNSLREQRLITEDEYRSKRTQILNDL
ncbi:hypothetical protein KI809_12350 [Geobacter pelophilus]|uniref:Short C-terminal domain-containing protein n=1 Tax=Geoanaerobacter pelophilus TaxID=60036 RepID=A0AAW4L1Y6_9BACT|nr:SHOCT domain-containing protein [Geoanaerobacter pelophilus]MBT0665089.1 hypothetical protein [Geoanaerobacter pelophilus]